jgi:succinate dehydrogenase/fumarate reductase flavoprotein subunit
MTETFDVIVIGFGVAGAIASIEAHDRRARVLILERQSTPGGISICGGGVRIADDADKATALYVAGALGSVFGHLYISGGNDTECLVGGRIAGRHAARFDPRPTRVVHRVAQPQA